MCMAAIGMIGGLVGGVMQGIGARNQAKAQQASLQAQADMERRQAAVEQTAGSYRAQRQQDQNARMQGQARAAVAGSGVSLAGGTYEDIIAESAEEGALDVAAIRWNSGLASDNYRYKSEVSTMNADNAGRSANLAFITPVLGSVARFGQQFGQTYASAAG